MNTAVILLGSNKGDMLLNLENAKKHVSDAAGKIFEVSSIYRTDPWGNKDQADFLNQIIVVSTTLNARELIKTLLEIEAQMGRERKVKWEPRLIDLDIIYFNDDIIQEPNLTIPHKHLHERRFVLQPLAEILPDMVHPVFGKNNKELLEALTDGLNVQPID
jgi:2-amino-4-hydroxy-6-hydroxymethyldihydropteridine diphosphokinase